MPQTMKTDVIDRLDEVRKQITMFRHLICCSETIRMPDDVGCGIFFTLQELAGKVEGIAATIETGWKDRA